MELFSFLLVANAEFPDNGTKTTGSSLDVQVC